MYGKNYILPSESFFPQPKKPEHFEQSPQQSLPLRLFLIIAAAAPAAKAATRIITRISAPFIFPP